MMFGFILQMLRPMAALGIPPGEVVIALTFTAMAAAIAAMAGMAAMAAAAVTDLPPGDKAMALVFWQLRQW